MKKGKLKNQRNKLNKRKTKRKGRFSKRKTNKKYNRRRNKTYNKRGGAGGSIAPSATLSGDDWAEVGAEVWPRCGIRTHIVLKTHKVYRILKESNMRHGKFLLFIVEEREVISGDNYLSGIYYKLYFVDDEEGTHDELQQRYANKPFQYDLTSIKVRGSTPLGCSIAGWGIEISSIDSGVQPLYKGILVNGPGIPSHLGVFSLSSPDPQGGKLDKYKGVKEDHSFINPIRLALDPETYTSEGGREMSDDLNTDLSSLCINGYGTGKKKVYVERTDGSVYYDDDLHVITINGRNGIVAKTRFKSGNGTVMALLNNSFEDKSGNDHSILYTEDTYHDFIIRHLKSLTEGVDLKSLTEGVEIDYIFFQSEMGAHQYTLIGQGTGNLMHFQSELNRDYKVGIGSQESVPRKTMCEIEIDGVVQMKCYFDTHPEYPLEVYDNSEKNKNLLIFKLNEVEKMIINYPGLLTPNTYQMKRTGGGWSDVERIELNYNGRVTFFFQGGQKNINIVNIKEALEGTDSEPVLKLK